MAYCSNCKDLRAYHSLVKHEMVRNPNPGTVLRESSVFFSCHGTPSLGRPQQREHSPWQVCVVPLLPAYMSQHWLYHTEGQDTQTSTTVTGNFFPCTTISSDLNSVESIMLLHRRTGAGLLHFQHLGDLQASWLWAKKGKTPVMAVLHYKALYAKEGGDTVLPTETSIANSY